MRISTTGTISVSVSGDTTVEGDETFVVNLTNASNASIADGQGTGSIVNDDLGSANLSIAKSASASRVAPGQTVTDTIAVTNAGPNAAQSVTVVDDLPSTTTFVSCTATNGGVCGGATTAGR